MRHTLRCNWCGNIVFIGEEFTGCPICSLGMLLHPKNCAECEAAEKFREELRLKRSKEEK